MIGVVLLAIFILPRAGDLDPLLVIFGIFIIIALLQHVGIVGAPSGDPENADRDHSGSSRRGGRDRGDQKEKVSELSSKDLVSDAELCLSQNNYSRVKDLATKATDLDPECARAWELLATAQKWEGKREEALATVRKAHDLYEVKSSGLTALAKELEGNHDPGALAAECERKGEAFVGRRQYDLAFECYTQAIDALGETNNGSTAIRLRRQRAECAQQLQDWSVCRRDATAVLEQEPNDAKVLLQRAAANEALEKFSAALDDARKCLSMDPKNSAANRILHNSQQALRS
eukprot:TRINITY_DN44705_c0_g1_i1.p1 TRINITY_DN44705_c0_g1~~TRINITY_DN44705_c0_g1_i1.p1  ORF type:complete len:330 (-),score=61.39 TRINITY_DN44705_c0_g1_i1:301-1167(-)